MGDLRTTLFDIEMSSPFILGSGPLSYSSQAVRAAFEAGVGGVTTKTLRLEAAVNPTPHIVVPRAQNLREALLNSEKWSDLTWQQWVDVELPALQGHPGLLIVSVGHIAAEAEAIVPLVTACSAVNVIECVSYAGPALPPMLRAVRKLTNLPLLAKLSFNWGDELMPIAEAALHAGADGFTAIDAIGPALEVNAETGEPTVGGAGNAAWLSGAPIRPFAQAVVANLVERFGKPVVGIGGVMQATDAVEMTMVGATAVGVVTGPLLHGLTWFVKTNAKLSQWLDNHGYDNMADIRGKALKRRQRVEDVLPLAFTFDALRCNQCGLCVALCPYRARRLTKTDAQNPALLAQVDAQACRSCGLCVGVCRSGALGYGNWPR
jgi:dihydroorotate dehydrogenase/NAD-dependent dihydropyrimidine dehydrogenase PreA subunit